MRGGDGSFVFTDKARNVPERRRLFSELDVTVPNEPPTKATNWRWETKVPALFKFVDDGTILSKVILYNAVIKEESGKSIHEKRDILTENVFNRSKRRAESKGMKINVDKTSMLVLSASKSFDPRVLYRV